MRTKLLNAVIVATDVGSTFVIRGTVLSLRGLGALRNWAESRMREVDREEHQMKLWNAKEGSDAVPPGRYKAKCTAAEAVISKSTAASPMISFTGEIIEGEHAGKVFYDNMITDQDFKGSGIGKKKLRGLGIEVDRPNVEIPDEQLAQMLLNRVFLVDLGDEDSMEETVKGSGNFDKPRMTMVNGVQVRQKKNVVKGYDTGGNIGAQPGALGGRQLAPPTQQQFTPPQAPPGWGAAAQAQGFTPPAQIQQFAPQQLPPQQLPPQQWQQPQGQQTQQWQGQQPQGQQTQFGPPQLPPQGFNPQTAQPPFAQQNWGPPAGTPVNGPAATLQRPRTE